MFVLWLYIERITFLGNLFNLHNWTLVSVCSQEEDRKKKLLLFLTNFQAWPRLLLPAQQPTTNTSFLEYLCYMCSDGFLCPKCWICCMFTKLFNIALFLSYQLCLIQKRFFAEDIWLRVEVLRAWNLFFLGDWLRHCTTL